MLAKIARLVVRAAGADWLTASGMADGMASQRGVPDASMARKLGGGSGCRLGRAGRRLQIAWRPSVIDDEFGATTCPVEGNCLLGSLSRTCVLREREAFAQRIESSADTGALGIKRITRAPAGGSQGSFLERTPSTLTRLRSEADHWLRIVCISATVDIAKLIGNKNN